MPRVTEAHTQARLKEIGDAAYRVFRRKGFAGATMQDIATEADLSIGALYHYFDSKEAIIHAVAEDVRERNVRLISAALAASDDTRERLRAEIEANFGRLRDPQTLANFGVVAQLMAEAPRNPAIRASLRQTGRIASEHLRPVWQDAHDRGEIDPDVDVEALTRAMMMMRDGLWMHMLSGDVPIDAVMRAAEALFTGTLWRPPPEDTTNKERDDE